MDNDSQNCAKKKNDSQKKPLLTILVDPPSNAAYFINTPKRRYRRCRSTPTPDVSSNHTKVLELVPESTSILNQLRPKMRHIALFLVLYLALATICFYMVKDQLKGAKTGGILDALYFSIVTMTTVGYGDLVPNSVTSKLLACAFVFTGMAIVGLLLGTAADYLVEKQEELIVNAFHVHSKAHEVDILNEIRTNRVTHKLYTTIACVFLLIVTGTLVLWKVEKLSLVDSFYCVCSTITTLGYGDESFSTEGGRIFAVIWILTSTICLAQVFLYIAEYNAEKKQQSLAKWVLNRRMTFTDLQAADIDEDGNVGAAEFIIYKLKEMGKISQQDIAVVLEEFEDLDVDQSRTITPADLMIAQSGR